MAWALFLAFFAYLIVGTPLAAALGLAVMTIIYFFTQIPLQIVAQRLFAGMDSFSLMAIPFFILAGDLMIAGGVSRRLIALAHKMVRTFPAGLPIAGVLACMGFAAISGSSPATVAAIGGLMIPAMKNAEYRDTFAVGLMTAAGSLGIIIPPSITMITYGVAVEQSIGRLFMGGIGPGILIGVLLSLTAVFFTRRDKMKAEPAPSFKELLAATKDAFWGMLTPVIILGGIYGGVFTPTESAVVAVVWALIVGLFIYREITWKTLPSIILKSGLTSAMIMLIIGSAVAFSWFLTFQRIPVQVAQWILGLSTNKFTILLAINVVLLIVGMFMDPSAAVLVLAPLFLPVVKRLGVDPIHFGIIMVVNMAIGMATPPFGLNLFVATGISNMSLQKVARSTLPFVAVLIIALLLVTYVPSISLWLPNRLYAR